MPRLAVTLLATAIAAAAVLVARGHSAEYAAWPTLEARFESTGGGGYVIENYYPVIIGDRCVTGFTTIAPDGGRTQNLAMFEAVPQAGGMLCTSGRWAAADGSAEGTTPIEVFIRDGLRRRSP